MPRVNKILLIIVSIFTVSFVVFIISVFVRISNDKNTHVNHSFNHPSVNYLDIQMDIHHNMYTLIMDIERLYQDSPEDIKLLLNYIEKLHEEAIILGSSNSNRLAKIITCAEDPESLRWVHEQLIWVVQPLDEVGDSRDAKIVTLIMTKEIEYLHGSLMFLAGGGIGGIGMEEAMMKAKDFKKKFKK